MPFVLVFLVVWLTSFASVVVWYRRCILMLSSFGFVLRHTLRNEAVLARDPDALASTTSLRQQPVCCNPIGCGDAINGCLCCISECHAHVGHDLDKRNAILSKASLWSARVNALVSI